MIRFAENLNKMIAAGLGGALEAPRTVLTLTPAQLSAPVGENNVWSNSGDVTLEYSYYEETEGY